MYCSQYIVYLFFLVLLVLCLWLADWLVLIDRCSSKGLFVWLWNERLCPGIDGLMWVGYHIFLSFIVFGIESLAVGFGCLVLTSIESSVIVGDVVDGVHEKVHFFHFVLSGWPMRLSMEWGMIFC